jgi:ketosteroid isomerase-like protein
MSTIEQEILDLEARRVAATNSADAEALAAILHEDYVHIGGIGNTLNRTAYIRWVGELRREHRRSNLKVVAQGDVALLVGDLENHICVKDGDTQVVQAVVLETVVRQDGQWRILSFQITPRRDYI